MRSRSVASAALAGALLVARSAAADDAKTLYDRAAAAYDAHDFASAASLFARADALAPDPTVLRLALAAAIQADDAVLGENLVLRAYGRAGTPELVAVEDEARRRFEPRVARVRVVCASDDPKCVARVGAVTLGGGDEHAFAPGSVEIDFGHRGKLRLGAVAGARLDAVQPAALAPVPARAGAERPEPSGLSPAWFVVGMVATAALGGVTIASGVDTASRHDAFVANPNANLQAAGEDAQLRTNILLGGTIGLAAITVLVGVLATRWSHAR